MAQLRATLGSKLVENFQLLLELHPNEELSSLINERILSLPDKRTFQCTMLYILDVLNPDWYSNKPFRMVTMQDERLFYIALSDNFKLLRMEFPEIGLPLMPPSSMVCFYGERSRETLLKITKGIMLHLMKKYNCERKIGDDVLMDHEALCEECDKISKELQQRREQEEKAFSLQRDVLHLMVSSGPWNEVEKKKLSDISNSNIVAEMQKRADASLKQLTSLKTELQPYFNHIHHKYRLIECECPPIFNVAEENVNKICELLWVSNKNRINVDILELKLLSAVRKLRLDYFKSINPSVEVDYNPPTALIQKLEKLVAEGDESPKTPPFVLQDSPLAVNQTMNHPGGDSPLSFTPAEGENSQKSVQFKRLPVKVDMKTVKELMVPDTIGVSPFRPHACRTLAKVKAKPNETIMTIVERMRMKATPCKYENQKVDSSDTRTSLASFSMSSDIRTKGTTAYGKFTPASKLGEFSILSQSTGRRQSMGFLKPTSCFARRQLKTETPLPKRQTFDGNREEKRNPTSDDDNNKDKTLDMIVQELVADKNCDNESSFSSANSDFLDSSLPIMECSSLGVNELPTSLSSRDFELTPTSPVEQVPSTLMESIKMEIKKDNEELADVRNSIISAINDSSEHLSDEEPDICLDPEMPKTFTVQPQEKMEASGAPKQRNSLNLLIERFNAVKLQLNNQKK